MEHRALSLKMVQQLQMRHIRDQAVLVAMVAVPRHVFVPDVSLETAYSDNALSIGDGQTISQPYVVARMTELLEIKPGMSVLEIGTGSGYQAAVLCEMGAKVLSIERRSVMADIARARLSEMMPDACFELVVGDGSLGYASQAPYDRILVTAAAPALPVALGDQLCDGGRVVIPIGQRDCQRMTIFERRGGELAKFYDFDCRFVPLVGKDAWEEMG